MALDVPILKHFRVTYNFNILLTPIKMLRPTPGIVQKLFLYIQTGELKSKNQFGQISSSKKTKSEKN